MSQLSCNCLNVTVNVTGDYKSQEKPTSSLFSQNCSHPLLTGNKSLFEVQLDVAGIVVRVLPLVVSTSLEDWVLTVCSNCNTLVYVTHSFKMDRTFVSQSLLNSKEAIRRVVERDSFSDIFQILLQPHEETETFRRKRVFSMSFGTEDPQMKQIHQQMKSYLTQEEEAMEERIRMYEQQQRLNFQSLQEKAHLQRRTLFAAITKVREEEVKRSSMSTGSGGSGTSGRLRDRSTQVGPATPSSAAGIGRNKSAVHPAVAQKSKPASSSSSRTSGRAPGQSEGRTNKTTVTITLRDDIPLNLAQMASDHSEEDDAAMFSLDGFDLEDGEGGVNERDGGYSGPLVAPVSGDVAFPQSDDEEISTDDSSFRDMSAVSGLNYGTSVPLDIPMYSKLPPTGAVRLSIGMGAGREEGNRELEGSLKLGELGNCIRQLALSVQDTGMFGDLPRPRMHEK